MCVQRGEIAVEIYDGRAQGMDWDVGSWLLIVSLRVCVCGKKETDSLVGHGAVGMVDLGYDKG